MAFCLSVAVVVAMEMALFAFVHAKHTRDEVLATVGAMRRSAAAPDDPAVVGGDPAVASAVLAVVCERERASVARANGHATVTGCLVSVAALAIGVVVLAMYYPAMRTSPGVLRGVSTEVAAFIAGVLAILACFHGMARGWRHRTPAELVVDVGRAYAAATTTAD